MDSSPLRKNQKALSVAILRRGNLRRKSTDDEYESRIYNCELHGDYRKPKE